MPDATHIGIQPAAATATVRYSDDARIDETTGVDALCQHPLCRLHADGDVECPVPETWGEVRALDDPGIHVPRPQR